MIYIEPFVVKVSVKIFQATCRMEKRKLVHALRQSVKRNQGKQRTAFHAIKDFNSLGQAIRLSMNLNTFKRDLFKFVI